MLRFGRAVGWVLVALAGVSAFGALLLGIARRDVEAVTAFLFFTGLTGLPGGLLLWRTGKAEGERTFRSELVGYLRTHDRFTVEEMARKIGRTELETERWIASISVDEKMDLLFHRADRSFVHRARLRGGRVVERCPACGAPFKGEVILPGESVACVYCGRDLASADAATG